MLNSYLKELGCLSKEELRQKFVSQELSWIVFANMKELGIINDDTFYYITGE